MKQAATGVCVMTAVLLAPSTVAQSVKPAPVALFVTTIGASDGFTDPNREHRDSAAEIVKALKRSEHIRVVTDRKAAKLVLTVMKREREPMGRAPIGAIGPGVQTTLTANLLVAGKSIEISGVGQGGAGSTDAAWTQAAFKVADQVHRWVQENRTALAK